MASLPSRDPGASNLMSCGLLEALRWSNLGLGSGSLGARELALPTSTAMSSQDDIQFLAKLVHKVGGIDADGGFDYGENGRRRS